MIKFLEKYFVPFAAKLGSVRFLVALRDAFVSVLPITIIGSLGILLNSLIEVIHDRYHLNTLYGALKPLITIDNVIYNGTFAIFSLLFAFSWGYHLAKAYEVNGISAGLISVSSFMMSIANVANINLAKPLTTDNQNILSDAKIIIKGNTLQINDVFSVDQLGTLGLMTAILFGALGVSIYIVMVKNHLTLNFKEQMPHASGIAFEALFPAIVGLFVVAGINYLFTSITGQYFGNFLINVIQAPLTKLGQGFWVVILITFLVQIFWFFGINGITVLAPVLDTIWLTPQNLNVMALKNGQTPEYIWTRGSFDAFAWFGGAGGTLLLVIAILVFSKKQDARTLAKVTIAPQIFNINEPIMYGLPVVFNTIYFIPFVLAPVVNVATAYIVTALGWVKPVQAMIPHIMPSVLQGWLATNYDWRAIALSLFNMVIAFLIWMPFVRAANKIRPEIDSGLERKW